MLIKQQWVSIRELINILLKRLLHKLYLVSIENVKFDMDEIDKGMRSVGKEFEIRLAAKSDTTVLNDFLSKTDAQFQDLKAKYQLSQEQFNNCVKYFGETPLTLSPNTFFTTFVKFIKAYKVKIY